ncbi:MAG: LPXTG cell wall anchor domain-containing protein, partial [Actinomycetota bacterium]|nr:LPXTG cell wall anchor domain-containing protein [Actinomycetota bacterium]
TARGNDVLVPGDVIDTLPDGTKVVGIDQITVETENCELTEQGDDLTTTLSDQSVPFRIRDGDNVDITLQEDGTIVANGRETLGDSFPEGERDNPDRLIEPIPVDPENDQFPETPNDTFPIISSTGIGGQGCRVIEQSADPGTEDVGADEDVIDDTIPDDPLPDTGGSPLLSVALLGFVLVAAGASVIRGGRR